MNKSHRKGLTLEQEYGDIRAKKIHENLRKAHLGVSLSVSHRHSLSLLAQRRKDKQNGHMNTPEAIEKMRISAIKQFKDLSQRELRRRMRLKLMSNPKYVQNTGIELKIKELLNKNKIDHISQYLFKNKYLCDFAILNKKIIIECDGDYWHNRPGAKEKDEKRDEYIKKNGWFILRFWEHEINKNIDLVENIILSNI